MTKKELGALFVGNVSNFIIKAGNEQATLKWTDPDDTVYEDVTLPWAGTRIVRKEGGYPENENDGIIVVDSNVKNEYSINGFVDTGLTNGTKYYYQAFPYTFIYNFDDKNKAVVISGEPLITTWNMTKGKFILPTHLGTYNAIIDWGDGTEPTTHTSGNPTHTYAENGIYQIKIIGTYSGFYMNNEAACRTQLLSVDSWGNVPVAHFYRSFFGCTNLISLPNEPIPYEPKETGFQLCFSNCTSLKSIPGNIFNNCENVTSFQCCFGYCTSLTSIPSELFSNCKNADCFSSSFSCCTSLTAIPSGLFDNCPNVTNFDSCFTCCTLLTSIPKGLFDYCKKNRIFECCFSTCTSLSNIPDGLFDNCPNVTCFRKCFLNCTSLTAIPTGLFDNCPNVNIFSDCFCNCTSLTSIPSGIFDNNLDVTSFGGCFSRCTSLKSVPNGIFEKCVNVTAYTYCFMHCRNLQLPEKIFNLEALKEKQPYMAYVFTVESEDYSYTGTVQDIWNYITVSSYNYSTSCFECFKNNTALTNYADIPGGWK